MVVGEAMTAQVRVVRPEQTIREAANLMAELDAGALPVVEGNKLVGMLTDRDIAVRAVALGKGPDTPVSAVMSEQVKCCFVDDDCAVVANEMAQERVRRLPVLDREERLVGIVSLGDLSTRYSSGSAGGALGYISE
ncbi:MULTISPECIES: CBS domain-containing protein [unclassified Methylobacterium]|jgi:CBS domain-containing protein|uniref:CBS domain-containing protein n=1 Tax=unclassified Methylobacterium TaxID=2615210 RepID=UPI0011C202F4|nr:MULTISPECIES: CBS domain-containing protein [unclassified Methylobacterium]QEE41303.1 CBS domain-containing protein [Methylobacterium sp. WL1]TXN57733.1 CBS domain-containing protein [Methylobacterium sp. WL2]